MTIALVLLAGTMAASAGEPVRDVLGRPLAAPKAAAGTYREARLPTGLGISVLDGSAVPPSAAPTGSTPAYPTTTGDFLAPSPPAPVAAGSTARINVLGEPVAPARSGPTAPVSGPSATVLHP